ncbi:hypothetical protein CTA2_295 [Colletotrichum tanaceti]|nr:hypothetical protein CTA2_295 [Colletotrichum tanaceti]
MLPHRTQSFNEIAMSLKKPTMPPRVSFGVELEFFVAFVLEGEPDPDADIKDGLQPLVTVPVNWEETEASCKGDVLEKKYEPRMEYIHDCIERALANSGLPVKGGKGKYDHVDGYRWQRVELNSPAMYDMKLSYDMIRLALPVPGEPQLRLSRPCWCWADTEDRRKDFATVRRAVVGS